MELMLLPLLLLLGLLTTLDGGDDDAGGGEDQGGSDTLAGSGTDRIFGGEGDDDISLTDEATGLGGVGNDTIRASGTATGYGLDGDDSLLGSDEATVMGGAGNDAIAATDWAVGYGLDGDDTLVGDENATIHGGEGDDRLIAGGEAAAYGGDGDDWLSAEADAAAYGGDGNDTLAASQDGQIAGGAGDDMLVYQDVGRITSPEDGADIYVLDHASGGASLQFDHGSRDATDRIAIYLGTDDLSNFRFSVESGSADGSDGPEGDFTEITISETLADGTTQNSSLFLRGVYGYGLRNIILYGEEIGEEVDWQAYFGENDNIQATGTETVYGGVGNDIIRTTETSVGYGGDGSDRLTSFGQSTVYGDAGNDLITASAHTTSYGGADDDSAIGSWNDTVYGGAGEDTIWASYTSVGHGDDGDDLITARGSALAYGGAGDDRLIISDRAVGDGGAGDDIFFVSDVFTTGEANVIGGAGHDLFVADMSTLSDGAHATIGDYEKGSDQLGVVLGGSFLGGYDLSGVQIMISEVEDETEDGIVTSTLIQLTSLSDAGNAFASFRLTGVTDFDPSDLKFYRNEIGDAPDWVPVGEGNDDVLVGDGVQTVNGGAGGDLVMLSDTALGRGGIGNDVLIVMGEATGEGGEGNDVLAGVTGSEGSLLRGGDGDDSLRGGDSLYGGAGNDDITNGLFAYGGDGDDVFNAGGAVYGGAGDDQVFRGGGGQVDLGSGDDLLQVTTGSTPGNFSTLAATLGDGADRLVFDPTDHDEITLNAADFDATEDILGVIGSPAELANLTLTRSYDAATNTTRLVLDRLTGDVGSETFVNLVGQDAMTASITVRLYADAAAVQAGVSYRSL